MSLKITVRNCRPDNTNDAVAYERLKDGAVFAHLLTRPGYDITSNLFFAAGGGAIIGFVNVVPELGIDRAVLDYAVSPTSEIKMVIPPLIKSALKRGREIGAAVAHVGVPHLESAPAETLLELGFGPVRRFCDLQLNISETDLEGADRMDWEHRYFSDGDMQLLSDIQNRCFAGEWGYNPNTVEDTAWQLRVRNNCPEDIVLALDKGVVIGYCWKESECGVDHSTGVPKGRIYMLGVDRHYRGKGLGRQLLLMGLAHLKKQGCGLIEITVDTQNTMAIALYQSLGFHICRETVWYERSLH